MCVPEQVTLSLTQGEYIYSRLEHRLSALLYERKEVFAAAIFLLVDIIALQQKDVVETIIAGPFSTKIGYLLISSNDDSNKLGRVTIERVKEIVENNSSLYNLVVVKEPFKQYLRPPGHYYTKNYAANRH